MSLTITVAQERCTACGACVEECPEHLQAPFGSHVDASHPLCNRCLHCYAICPVGAIVVVEVGDEESDEVAPRPGVPETEAAPPDLSPAALERFFAYRRSTRQFEDQPLSPALIKRVLGAARYVPSGGNRHAYQFTVLTDDGVKEALSAEFLRIYRLRHTILESTFLRWALRPFVDPYTRAFLRDTEWGQRVKTLLDRFEAGEDPIFYGAPAVVLVHCRELIPTPVADGVLAAYHVVLMAQALGLGTCFVTFAKSAINESRTCKELLGLSPEDTVHAVVLLGYPRVRYRRRVPKEQPEIAWV